MTEKIQSVHHSDDPDGGMSASELLFSLWNTRRAVATALVLTALALAGTLLFLRATMPTMYSFNNAIRFVFPGAETGTYPNGVKFELSDLIAPQVIQKVYSDNNLSKYGIENDVFADAVSVSPYSPSVNEVISRFRGRLENRKLTLTERERIEAEMATQLQRISRGNALIRLDIQSQFGISKQLGEKIVHDIPRAWSEISIKSRGVLKLPAASEYKTLIDVPVLKKLDYPGLLVLLNDAVARVKKGLTELQDFNGSETISDPESKHTPISLRRAIETFEAFDLQNLNALTLQSGVVKSPEKSRLFLQQKIDSLELKKIELKAKSTAILSSIAAYVRPSYANDAGAAQPVPSSPVLEGTPSSPQIGADFIDRIIELQNKGMHEEFRRKLVEKHLELQNSIAVVDHQISSIKKVLNKVANAQADSTFDRSKLDADYADAVKQLNDYWSVLTNLYEQLSAKHISFSRELYSPLVVENRSSSYHPILNMQIVYLCIAALLSVALLAALASFLMQLFRRTHGT